MADKWETKYCFNPNDATDGNKEFDNDGYTIVEEFLNGSVPSSCLFTGLTADNSKETFSVYPTPANNDINIQGNISTGNTYEITSMEGKSLQAGIVAEGSVSVENLKTAIYIIKIKSNAAETEKGFVKE